MIAGGHDRRIRPNRKGNISNRIYMEFTCTKLDLHSLGQKFFTKNGMCIAKIFVSTAIVALVGDILLDHVQVPPTNLAVGVATVLAKNCTVFTPLREATINPNKTST